MFNKTIFFLSFITIVFDFEAQAANFQADWVAAFGYFATPSEFNASSVEIASSMTWQAQVFEKSQDPYLFCKFPARAFLLSQKGLISVKDFSLCPELQEFFNKAPFEKLSIVFAGESLTQPASIMGHSFLKLTGQNKKNIKLDHTISFFTRMDDVNPLQLVIQSFITGKNGFYALGPFGDSIDYYIKSEGRNLWEYELSLTQEQLIFFKYYLFELKNIKFKYYFHAFNCATLIKNILAVVYPEVQTAGHLWVTPLDLVKALKQSDRVVERRIYPSSSWIIKQLNQVPGYKLNANLDSNKSYISEEEKAYTYHYIKAYQDYLLENNKIDREQFNARIQDINRKFNDYEKYDQMSFENLPGPERTVSDSQIAFSAYRYKSTSMYGLYLLPLSHEIVNDLTGYAFESEVRLFGIDLLLSESDELKVNTIDVFKVASYKYHDPLTGGLSGQISFSYQDNAENISLSERRAGEVTLSLGKTFRLFQDIDFYIWPSALISMHQNVNLNANPQLGFVMRQFYDMKLFTNYEYQFDAEGNFLNRIKIVQSFNFKNYSFGIKYSRFFNRISDYEKSGAYFMILF